jgi:hypothetical protein
MKFNICLIQPKNYIHTFAFLELAQLLHFGIRSLNFDSKLSLNQIYTDATNIVIGAHLLDVSRISQLPKNSIILNTEQLDGINIAWLTPILQFAKHFSLWDYSLKNISKLNDLGFNKVKFLELGYQSELQRIPKSSLQDIDVLFYGSMNPRREKIIAELREHDLNVHVSFAVYGPQRDELISRSKVVLNHHYYDTEIYEVVRSSYLINNAKLVVSEVNPSTSIDNRYLESVYPAKYEELAATCSKLVCDTSLRNELEEKALSTFRQFPQSRFLTKIL